MYPQLPQASDIQQPNPSETATIQNTSEFSEETVQTVQNTQCPTITNDSNLIQVRIHYVTPDQTNNQNQDNTLSTTRDNTSILSTSYTNITQPSQTQRSFRPDNRPYISSNISPETTPEEQNFYLLPHSTRQKQYNQDKMILSTFSKVKNLTNQIHCIHNYHKLLIYNS